MEIATIRQEMWQVVYKGCMGTKMPCRPKRFTLQGAQGKGR